MADDADEVKVFSSQDEEDDDQQEQLVEDKKEVVKEAELESGPQDPIGVNGAFSRPQVQPMSPFLGLAANMSLGALSPNLMNPFLMGGLMRNPMSPGFMPMWPMTSMSPSFAQFMPMMGPVSPFYAVSAAMANVKMEPGVPLAPSMRGNPLNTLNQMNQMRFQNSPLTNGIRDLSRTHGGKIKKEEHIKKPLNAFMWFMKENRPKMLNDPEYKDKQSAELNKQLGKKWRELTQEEQKKYFDMAQKDKEDHKAKFPAWSARENYAVHKKKKKRRDRTEDTVETKKCRARFGTHRMEEWCKFCRRKKKCEWATVVENDNMSDGHDRISASGSSGPSPMASSSSMGGPSPMNSHRDSDSESDIDAEMDDIEDDEPGDQTLMADALQDLAKADPTLA